MRGKVHFLKIGLNERGITPACAGKSWLFWISAGVFWDHPRVCGEKPAVAALSMGFSGSPPRMRGKAQGADRLDCRVGITPACAGKSRFPSSKAPSRRDHPRVCGEKSGQGAKKKKQVGSPPRVRGKDAGCFVHHDKHRITPAYAGKSDTP